MGFEQIVSLGHNCPVAASMEKYGFRSFSGPFDWLGSKFVSNYEDSEIQGG